MKFGNHAVVAVLAGGFSLVSAADKSSNFRQRFEPDRKRANRTTNNTNEVKAKNHKEINPHQHEKSQPTTRIVGGGQASVGEYPYFGT